MNYDMTKPCAKCPFRTDVPPYLLPERVEEIEAVLDRGEFTCHETTVPVEGDDGSTDMEDGPNAQHCAGALILLEKLERPSQMMRICERLGMYDRRKLDMDAPVYESFEEMTEACAEQLSRARHGRRKATR